MCIVVVVLCVIVVGFGRVYFCSCLVFIVVGLAMCIVVVVLCILL